MSNRRVLLFSAQRLFGESIEKALSQVEDLEIAGHWNIDAQVLEHVAGSHPDIVFFACESGSLDVTSQLTTLVLERYPELSVFWVTLDRDQVQVFNSQVVPARSADLIDLIHRLPFKSP